MFRLRKIDRPVRVYLLAEKNKFSACECGMRRRGNIPVRDTVNNNDKEGPEDQKRIRFWGTLRRNLLKSNNGETVDADEIQDFYISEFLFEMERGYYRGSVEVC